MADLRRNCGVILLAAVLLACPTTTWAQETKSGVSDAATPPPTLEPIRKPGSPAPFVAFSVAPAPTAPAPATHAAPHFAPAAVPVPASPKPHRQNAARAFWHRLTHPRQQISWTFVAHQFAPKHHAAPQATVVPAPKPVVVTAPVAPAPAKATAPASAPVVVETTPAPPPAPKPVSAPMPAPVAPPDALEALTRDGSEHKSADAGAGMSPVEQALRTAGALVVALVAIVVAVNILRKYRSWMDKVGTKHPAKVTPQATEAKPIAFSLGSFIGTRESQSGSEQAVEHNLGTGALEVLNSQELPGSGTVVYLVRAADRMMLLGASNQGGVRMLAEWDIDETRTAAERDAAFDSYLEAQGVIKPQPAAVEAEVSAVRSLLHQASDRLTHKIGHGSGAFE